jgi:outer membrane protein OmpA-like peptidoglycan-associated protein/tetratricopeptide (TPR) repeat protein
MFLKRLSEMWDNKISYGTTLRFLFFIVPLQLLLQFQYVAAQTQQTDARTTFSDAEYYFLYQDFSEALPLYLKLAEEEPQNSNICYKIGVCYLNLSGQKVKAIPYLESAVKSIGQNYKEGSFKELSAPVEAFFHLGNAYRIANRIDEAIESFSIYKDKLDPKDVINYDFAVQQINACKRAREMMAMPLSVNYEVINLFENSGKYSHSPVLSENGEHLIFSVQEKFYDAIYWAKRKGNSWGYPINITLDLGAEGEIYATSINSSGTQIFLFKNDRGVGNIYTSIFKDDKWGKIVKVSGNINSRYWETNASITTDEKTLFFTSNRRGGYGGLDIYYSILLPNGQWGTPINLGPTINTPFNEESPYLMNDNETLVFSSQGHNSMGGYDIFSTKRIAENIWSTPSNMGYPISTTDDDMSFFPVSEGKGLVSIPDAFSPNQRQISMVTFSGQVVRTHIPINGKLLLSDNKEVAGSVFNINISDFETGTIIEKLNPTGTEGEFELVVPPGVYRIIASGNGYFPDTLIVAIPPNFQQNKYPVSFNLVPESVSKGEFLSVRSIQFDFDSYSLSRDSKFEAERIFGFMTKYPNLTIQVTGHTDSKGSAAYNKKLSQKRAQVLIDYLMERGVAKDRMVLKAAGPFENIASNINPDGTDNPEGRLYNRRATIAIVNSNGNVQLRDDLEVPEHLKPRIQKYSVLLVPLGQTLSGVMLDKLKQNTKREPKVLAGKGKKRAYIVGSFDHKAEAISLLDQCIDIGFNEASLTGIDDLTLTLSHSTNRTFSSPESAKEKLFTIQILSSLEPTDVKVPNKKVEVTKAKDGMYKYIYGRYDNVESADSDLSQIKAIYPDAFVINIKRYEE